MAYGHDPTNGDPAPQGNWQTIIHRDLKPENVFLALPRTPDDGDIPELRLGDWGISVPEQYDALENPKAMLGAGTLGRMAPEQHFLSQDIAPVYPLPSWTNVWNVGRIMLALVELYPETPREVHYQHPQDGQVTLGPNDRENRVFYGEELFELIELCIERDPRNRITADNLLRSIREERTNDPPHSEEEHVGLEYDDELVWGLYQGEGQE